MIQELGVVGKHAPAGGTGYHLLLGVAAEVFSKLTAVFEGAGAAFPATQHHMVVLANCFVFIAQAVRFHVPIEPLRVVKGALTVLPQTQEVVRDVRDDVPALEVQDAGAEICLALQGLQPPLLQLGVVAVEVDVADEISRTVQRAKAALLPQAGEFFPKRVILLFLLPGTMQVLLQVLSDMLAEFLHG